MFRQVAADGEQADVEIEISDACAGLIRDTTGGRLEIHAHARIVSAGRELDRLFLYAEELLFLGFGREAVKRAAARAVYTVAENLEPAFANSEPTVAWLIRRDIQPVGSTLVWPPRAQSNVFAEIGGGLLMGGGEENTPSILAKVGIARQWFVLQGVVGAWAPAFMAAPTNSGFADVRMPANLRTFDLGLEAGPFLRLGPAFEIRAGAGAHLFFGGADVSPSPGSSSFVHLAPNLFAAVQTAAFPSATGRRFRFGIEVRKYFHATVGLPELSRTIPAASLGVAAVLGLEWPLDGGRR
jgi:hypothetical protein